MPLIEHWAVFIDNNSAKENLTDALLNGPAPDKLNVFEGRKGILFSSSVLEKFMDEEERHGDKTLTADTQQSLRSMSSGERKKALLRYALDSRPEFIILDNPFDNLDVDAQADLKNHLEKVSQKIAVVQLLSRYADLLPFIEHFARLDDNRPVLVDVGKTSGFGQNQNPSGFEFKPKIPPPLQSLPIIGDVLIELKSVNVSYQEKPILKNIDWTIKKNEFWELRGKNGSGKTTILSMITGENPKGYGQELYIFGRKKGSGESIWDIKKNIGYFTPAMTDQFRGHHSVEQMLISGLNDSVGLYVEPSGVQLRLSKQWLQLIGLAELKDRAFHNLSTGQKRLVMCARAMIKHPPLLILDEPTVGLDDTSAMMFTTLVNQFAKESETTIIFVSHRKEVGLEPLSIYGLQPSPFGSTGRIIK